MTNFLSPKQEVCEGGRFKYVRLNTGEIRFVDVCKTWVAHAGMVDSDETPVAGGFIRVAPNGIGNDRSRLVEVTGYGSSSLSVPSLPDDEDVIQKFLFGSV